MNPATFLRVLGPEPWKVSYDEPSIRPDDSRYGTNPNRLQRHTQFQVIVKPAPASPQELVVASYRALGIDVCKHDVRFVEDNWESPALGAWGLGWEVWLDGMEVTQFTYFQQAGGMPLESVAVEITYGLERIIMALQGKTHFKDIAFSEHVTYGEIFLQNEVEMSRYHLDDADVERNNQLFQLYEAESSAMIKKRLPIPAYNYLLKTSHTFNILDSRGAIGVTERARYFQRMRTLARDIAKLWVARREEEGYPLLQPASKPSQPSTQKQAPKKVKSPTASFVFELGVEELPPADVRATIKQLKSLLSTVLDDNRLSYSSIEVDGTPRRVSAFVRDLQTRQEDLSSRIRGPPLRAALKDGQPTKAALGFLRSQGVDAGDDSVEYDEESGYMYASVDRVGREAVDVLADKLPEAVLAKIGFGRSMRWNETGVGFSRPVRWLLCLLDDIVVPFEYAGVTSGDCVRSLRGEDGFATDIKVPSADGYHGVLDGLQIVVSRTKRASRIRSEASRLAKEVGGVIPEEYLHGGLMEEVTDLVENPIPLVGRFDETFLTLPDDVLVTVMKKHQRYFPVVDEASGKLINAFITVANGNSSLVDIGAICYGNEAVLRARYSDAAFFYGKDTKEKKLGDFVDDLADLTFQESLGSMLDKVRRVQLTTRETAALLQMTESESEDAVQVAGLYKADLATSMVVEMTSLAGTMGRHYAEKSKEVSQTVSQAIFEASLPRFSGDKVAESMVGAAVSIADRIDSLVALFSVGLMPKATADPFALRRAALGTVQTLIGNGCNVDIRDVVAVAAGTIVDQTKRDITSKTIRQVNEFITRRLEAHLLDGVGIRDDVVKAVLCVDVNAADPVRAVGLCTELASMISDSNQKDTVALAVETHGRSARLLKSIKDVPMGSLRKTEVDVVLFDCDEERQLWEALSSPTGGNDVRGKLEKLVEMKGVVDSFFDGVFVNAEDQKTRLNRLALCANIVAITEDTFDLSKLQL